MGLKNPPKISKMKMDSEDNNNYTYDEEMDAGDDLKRKQQPTPSTSNNASAKTTEKTYREQIKGHL